MRNLICLFAFIIISLSFQSCQHGSIKGLPKAEDCLILSESMLCLDDRMNDRQVDSLIQKVNANASIPEELKPEIVQYFENNRAEIVKTKEYELDLKYKRFFRGYSCTNAEDRNQMYLAISKMAKRIEELEAQVRDCQ